MKSKLQILSFLWGIFVYAKAIVLGKCATLGEQAAR
jgi:hypothetical protein